MPIHDTKEGKPLLTVDGVEVKLSTFDNSQIKVVDGGLRLSLQNYTGEIFFSTVKVPPPPFSQKSC